MRKLTALLSEVLLRIAAEVEGELVGITACRDD